MGSSPLTYPLQLDERTQPSHQREAFSASIRALAGSGNAPQDRRPVTYQPGPKPHVSKSPWIQGLKARHKTSRSPASNEHETFTPASNALFVPIFYDFGGSNLANRFSCFKTGRLVEPEKHTQSLDTAAILTTNLEKVPSHFSMSALACYRRYRNEPRRVGGHSPTSRCK